MTGPTTARGTINQNRQMVLGPTGQEGTDHGQYVYVLRCLDCGEEYGANGSDLWLRRCPACGGGAKGFEVTSADVLPEDTSGVSRNPPWTRDELILALALYMTNPGHQPGKTSKEIADLSALLNRLSGQLAGGRRDDFRNPAGVYMKLMNFRRFDPAYISEGRVGLTRGNRLEEEVWAEFATDLPRLRSVAAAITRAVALGEVEAGPDAPVEMMEAVEGRVLTKLHAVRERDRKLVERRKARAMRDEGKLACVACGFDFEAAYGPRGRGFIECHHVRPVESLSREGQKVSEADLELVCSNCHRMIHAQRPWLSIQEVKRLLDPICRAAE